jgi:hypothetical protein
MQKEEKSGQRKWDGDAFEPPPFIWDELENENPEKICNNSLAKYESNKGFQLQFLNQVFQIIPSKKNITPIYDFIPAIKSYELDLILLTYLLKSQPIPIKGEMINEKQILGGEAFFRGPHRLNTAPIVEKFGEDEEFFLSTGKKLGGEVKNLGDAAVYFRVFPRVPVTLILWKKDDEFPAQVSVNFDVTISEHLPLDCIWAMIHVLSKWIVMISL